MKSLKKFRWRHIGPALMGAALMLILHSCLTFRMSDKEIDAFFKKHGVKGSRGEYTIHQRTIHFAEAGEAGGPLVIFVHGSPGSLSAFIDFLADTLLTSRARVVTTDRPGFGHSTFGIAEPSLARQALCLKPLLETNTSGPVILVGHSLGGPVIARMAMDYPDLVDGLVLVAPSIDPELEPNETWFRAPLATPFLSWILPRSLRASNEEIYQLKPQLNEMLPLWKDIRCPVVVIQGEKDGLVPAGNADFAAKMLVNAPVTILRKPDMGHFVPWTNPELIQEAVLGLLSIKTPKLLSVSE